MSLSCVVLYPTTHVCTLSVELCCVEYVSRVYASLSCVVLYPTIHVCTLSVELCCVGYVSRVYVSLMCRAISYYICMYVEC